MTVSFEGSIKSGFLVRCLLILYYIILKDHLRKQVTYMTLCVVDSTGYRMVLKTKNIQRMLSCSYMQKNTEMTLCNMYSKLERRLKGFILAVP